jgi:hypothetical protein
MGYKAPYNKVGKVEPKLRNQSKSGLRMNDASPLNQPDDPKKPKIDLKAIKEKAAQLQTQKTADSLKSIREFKVAEDRLPMSRKQYISTGQEHLLKEIDKKAGEKYAKKAYDFDVIQPTEEFPHTGVSWGKSAYMGSGYDIGAGERGGWGFGDKPTTLAKQKLSGYEQDRARKIIEYAKKVR